MSNGQDTVRVLGPDNRHYIMPHGTTKEQAIAYFKKKGIVSAESPRPKAAQAAPASVPAPVKETQKDPGSRWDIQARKAMEGLQQLPRPRWDTPQAILQDPTWYGRTGRYLGGEFIGAGKAGLGMAIGGGQFLHDIASAVNPFEGYDRPAFAAQKQVGKDIVSGGEFVLDTGQAIWDLIRHFPEASQDPEKFGQTILNTALIVDAGVKVAEKSAAHLKLDPAEAQRVAYRMTRDPIKALLDKKTLAEDWRHKKGMQIAKMFDKADKKVQERASIRARNIAEQVDKNVPNVVSSSEIAQNILDIQKELVKTKTPLHPILRTMLKDAQSSLGWSWEKTKQYRSAVGEAIWDSSGSDRAVLSKMYKEVLTPRLRDPAYKYGFKDDWDDYNKVTSLRDEKYGDILRGIREAQHGDKVGGILKANGARVRELMKDYKDYGKDYGLDKEVARFESLWGKLAKEIGGWRGTLFRMAYGTPVGVPVMLAERVAGGSWIGGVMSGAIAGYASQALIRAARVWRLMPELEELILQEKHFGPEKPLGKFKAPEGEEPPALPPPKTEPPHAGEPRLPAAPAPPEVAKTEALAAGSTKPRVKRLTALQGGHAGGGVASVEELARPGRFVKISRGGQPTDMGKSPDFSLKEGEAGYQVKPDGTYELKAGQETDVTKHGVEAYVKARGLGAKAPPEAVGREPGVKPGTTKESAIGRRTKARERVARVRKEKGPTALGGGGQEISGGDVAGKALAAKEAAAAKARAESGNVSVEEFSVPEMEEHIRAESPEDWDMLQRVRKEKNLTDTEYIAGLRYLTVELLEKR
jgi:hypothetical protein